MRPGRPATAFWIGAALASAAMIVGPHRARAQESPHGTLTSAVDCIACHTGDAWVPARDPLDFDHDRQTGFPLTDSHARAQCSDCHLALRFDEPKGPGGDCASCHVDVHLGTLGLDCASCHDTDSFVSAPSQDQHAMTGFPLTGAHALLVCEACHQNDRGGQYAGLDTGCIACHASDYETAIPDHAARGFPTDCLQCHSVQAWRAAAAFDHVSEANGFALLGAHALVPCEGCHIRPGNELRWQPAGESDCIACHQTDYDREHQGTNFPTDCLQCHTRGSWDAGDFDHALTGFPLIGTHADAGCESCHGPGNALRFPVPSTPDDCVSCHLSDYEDEHGGSSIPTTCADCHNQSDWEAAANFDHAVTGFALLDPHGTLVCANCHRPADNALVFPQPSGQNDCVACHRADFDREHTATSFPTTCLDCHASSHWDGAVFDHEGFFPIASGQHSNVACDECHTMPSNPTAFSCTSCHEHRQSEADAEHSDVNGYVYQSQACYNCHPDGRS